MDITVLVPLAIHNWEVDDPSPRPRDLCTNVKRTGVQRMLSTPGLISSMLDALLVRTWALKERNKSGT